MNADSVKARLKKKKALVQVSMNDVIDTVRTFAQPLLDSETERCNVSRWNPETEKWEAQ